PFAMVDTSRVITFLFSCAGHAANLHSFPTRRSSDLQLGTAQLWAEKRWWEAGGNTASGNPSTELHPNLELPLSFSEWVSPWTMRSEEHTSELQSRSDLVCRLLLEKKKKPNRYSDLTH